MLPYGLASSVGDVEDCNFPFYRFLGQSRLFPFCPPFKT